MQIKNIMTTNVHTLKRNNTLLEGCIIMRNKNIGAIPIVNDDNEVEGIITDRDIVLALASNHKLNDKIDSFMTKDVSYLEETAHLFDLCDLISVRQIKRIPITRNNKLVGIVSVSDLTRSNTTEEYAKDLFIDISYDPLKEFEDPNKYLEVDDFRL